MSRFRNSFTFILLSLLLLELEIPTALGMPEGEPQDKAAAILQDANQRWNDASQVTGQFRYEIVYPDTSERSTLRHSGTFQIQKRSDGPPRFLLQFDSEPSASGKGLRIWSDGESVFRQTSEPDFPVRASVFRGGAQLLRESSLGIASHYLATDSLEKLISYRPERVDRATKLSKPVIAITAPTRRWRYTFSQSGDLISQVMISGEGTDQRSIETIRYSEIELDGDTDLKWPDLANTNVREFDADGPDLKLDLSQMTIRDMKGKRVSLSEFRGKLIVMDFWASWCAPCLPSIPRLEELRKRMDRDDVVFLLVSWNDTPENAIAMAKQRDFQLPLYQIQEESSAVLQLPILGIPTLMIVDREGKLLDYQVGSHGLAGIKALEAILQANQP